MVALQVVTALSVLAVFAILLAGLIMFAHPSERVRARTNLMMRLRVAGQGLAVGLLALVSYLAH